MEVGKLTVQQRGLTGKGISRRTRQGGDVPGVCYGAGMEAPIAVTIDPRALKASLDPKRRRNTVIDVTIEGDSAPINLKAMLWDYQFDAIRQEVTHVDLKSIDPEKSVDAEVPVISSGIHKGAIDGGLLSWARHAINITAKPGEIPTELVLDISELGIGDTLHISDLPLPGGVVLADLAKLTVVTCIAPKGLKSDDVKSETEETSTEESS